MQTDNPTDMVDARRRFLATCGRYALITPPVVTLLLSSTAQNYAVAGSGNGRRHRHSRNSDDTDRSVGARQRAIASRDPAQDDKRSA